MSLLLVHVPFMGFAESGKDARLPRSADPSSRSDVTQLVESSKSRWQLQEQLLGSAASLCSTSFQASCDLTYFYAERVMLVGRSVLSQWSFRLVHRKDLSSAIRPRPNSGVAEYSFRACSRWGVCLAENLNVRSRIGHKSHTVRMASLTAHSRKHKVCVVGSGNWGTTIAKVVAENTKEHGDIFEEEVKMWVHEEEYQIPKTSPHYDANSVLCKHPQKLSELINHLHENPKYLPNIALPRTVRAVPDITEAVKDATILIFNMPHQFIGKICEQLKGKILPYARGVSCIKGVDVSDMRCELISDSIASKLGIYCGALSGANIASEIAQSKYSETTVAYDPPPMDSQHPTPSGTPGGSPTQSHLNLHSLKDMDQSEFTQSPHIWGVDYSY